MFEPAIELERLRWVTIIAPDGIVDVHSFASEEGSEDFNADLSCVRTSQLYCPMFLHSLLGCYICKIEINNI